MAVTTLNRQAGRRYRQFSNTSTGKIDSINARGTSAAPAFTAKFRRTLSALGTRIGTRQIHW